MLQIDFFNLETKESPREILETDFPRLGPLPIKGGWGYNQSTACVIDRGDPTVDHDVPFDGVAIERIFAEYRLYEELIIFRPRGQKYSGIQHTISNQRLLEIEGRRYDVLTFQVAAFPEADFNRLKSTYEGPNGFRNPSFDAHAHEELHKSLMHAGNREYWFDITSIHSRN